MDYMIVYKALHALLSTQDYVTRDGRLIKVNSRSIDVIYPDGEKENLSPAFLYVSVGDRQAKLQTILDDFDQSYPITNLGRDFKINLFTHMLESVHTGHATKFEDACRFETKAVDWGTYFVSTFYNVTEPGTESEAVNILYEPQTKELRVRASVSSALSGDTTSSIVAKLINDVGAPSRSAAYQLVQAGLSVFYRHISDPVDPVVQDVKKTASNCTVNLIVQERHVDPAFADNAFPNYCNLYANDDLANIESLLKSRELRDAFWRLEVKPLISVNVTDVEHLFKTCAKLKEEKGAKLGYDCFDDGVMILTLNGSSGNKRIILDYSSSAISLYNCTTDDIEGLLTTAYNKLDPETDAAIAKTTLGIITDESADKIEGAITTANKLTEYIKRNAPTDPGFEFIRIMKVKGVDNVEELINSFFEDIGYHMF